MAKRKTVPIETFDLKKFYKRLSIAKSEQAAVAECFARGLRLYYRHIYGYDKYGRYPEWLIPERMYEPYIFGFGAVEAIRQESLSLETRLKIVEHAFQQINVTAEYGIPHGLPAMLSFLAAAGVLEPEVFRSVMIAADFGDDLFDGWQPDEVQALLDWVVGQTDIPEPERRWWIWHISVHCEQAPMCRALVGWLMEHPGLSRAGRRQLAEAWLADTAAGAPPPQWAATQALLQGDMEAFQAHSAEAGIPLPEDLPSPEEVETDFDFALDVLADEEDEFYEPLPSFHLLRKMLVGPMGMIALTPGALKRAALAALPALGEDPVLLCEKYLGSTRGYHADAINAAVADVMRVHRDEIPARKARALVERGLKIGQVTTRKAFYQLGADLLGPEYWERAATDNAKSIREWAAKKKGSPKRRGRQPRTGKTK